jgi:asparagine synthase (glutamine-hydrolysing)
MTVSRESIRLRGYWALDPSQELHLHGDDEYAEAFRQLFTEAVQCRLHSAFPVGSHLSGGLDSSVITCVARTLWPERAKSLLHTFSNIFTDVPECDERPSSMRSSHKEVCCRTMCMLTGRAPSRYRARSPVPGGTLYRPQSLLPWGLNRAAQRVGCALSWMVLTATPPYRTVLSISPSWPGEGGNVCC